MAYRAEVIADSSGNWAGNSLVFETREEAQLYAQDLASRWMLVQEWRTVETDEQPNYRFHADGTYTRIEDEQAQTEA